MADAGTKVFLSFGKFRGTTGAELYGLMKKIVERSVIKLRRMREALENGTLRRPASLDRDGRAARLAALLVSPCDSPEQAAILRENKMAVRRAMRRLPAS